MEDPSASIMTYMGIISQVYTIEIYYYNVAAVGEKFAMDRQTLYFTTGVA